METRPTKLSANDLSPGIESGSKPGLPMPTYQPCSLPVPGGLLAQGTVVADSVVGPPPVLAEDHGFERRVEEFAMEQLVTEFAIERLHVAVLPPCSTACGCFNQSCYFSSFFRRFTWSIRSPPDLFSPVVICLFRDAELVD